MERTKGFTLLEIIVSLLILSLVIAGTMSAFTASRRYIKRAQHRLQATNIARGILEDLYREVRQDTWDTGRLRNGYSETNTVTIDNITYTSNLTVSDVSGHQYRQVTVNVTWTEP